MPELIEDADFNVKLNEIGRNVDHTSKFLEKGVEDITLTGYTVPFGYRLVKAKTENQYRLITDNAHPVTAYAVKLNFYDHIVMNHKTCTQVMVWRTIRAEHRHAIRDLAILFFEHLIQQYTVVVSDSQQTELGRRFWESRIMESLSAEDRHVYVSDGTEGNRDGIIPLFEVTTDSEFYSVWREFCWGKEKDVHSHRLL